MSFNGSGSFLINTAGQPVVSGTVISSTAFNALTADLATGLSTCITKDGQTTVTANIPMANYKFTGLGAGSGAADSANLSQVQSTVVKLLASVSGTDTITAVGSPTVAAYAAGQMFYFVAAGDNTGAVTLNIDSLGAKNVTRDGSVALAAGDIKSGEVVVVVYDGTRFQVVSQLNSSGDARFANVSIASALNVGGVATVTGGAVLNGGVVINEPGADVDFRVEGDTDANLIFADASTDRVGIGTSSPATKLHVAGTSTFRDAALFGNTGFTNGIINSNDGLVFAIDADNDDANDNNNFLWLKDTATGSGGTTLMTLRATGNLGLGVTPSAWSTGKALQTQAGSLYAFSSSLLDVNQNAYYDGAYKYVNTAAASFYRQNSGTHSWSVAASGTAGNTITFYEAMNVGLSVITLSADEGNVSAASSIRFRTDGTERMRLDLDGNLGVGTSSPAARTHILGANTASRGQLTVVGDGADSRITLYRDSTFHAAFAASSTDSYIGTESSTPFRFLTNGSERARITAAGQVQINTTSGGFDGFLFVRSGASATEAISCWNDATTGDNELINFFTDGGTGRGSITYNRGAGQVAYNVTSDIRLKDNITDAVDAGSKIDALQVRQFSWKETGNHVDYGFVAQELDAIAPQAVSKPEDEEAMWSVDYSKLVPMLVKEIQSLRARVAALEGA